MEQLWHNLQLDEAITALGSRLSGLSGAEVEKRLQQYGTNEIKGKKKLSPIVVFLRQFLSPLIYVLITAVILSFAVQHYLDGIVILGVLTLNAIVGYLQESRAEKAMEALVQMAAPRAKVRRGDVLKQIPARNVVPGDILLLETGDMIPADARLIELSNLKVNEAMLTGESMPIDKHSKILGRDVPVAERKNMVFMGTTVSYGRAIAVAVTTGMSTELGKIADAIREVKTEKTPLQQSIGKLSRYLVVTFLGIIAVLVIVGLIKGFDRLEIFLLAVAAAVSAIPEGLPAVVTVVLAMGMQMMARNNAVVRRLVAVETLGSATIICSDKTGTLTMNEMTARRMYVAGEWIDITGKGYEPFGEFYHEGKLLTPASKEVLELHLIIGALSNDALLTSEDSRHGIYGDPTEGALVVTAAKAGMNKEKLEGKYPRLDEIPFQSEKQYMATLHHKDGGGRIVYAKGSAEKLLAMSQSVLTEDGLLPLSRSEIERIIQATVSMAKEGMRVIATAYIELNDEVEGLKEDDIYGKLIFVGLTGMDDPPRQEAKEAVKLCRQAGIKVVMITGDHKVTAESIAGQLGLPPGRTVTGPELQAISDEELSDQIENISVFARIEPLHKLKIVNAFKARGHVVAMTGDGVNDAPALKSASIGVAMGITGTAVAKEASDIVLADDNFASVVAAIDEGRAIFNRLRNVIFFLLSTNIGELLALILCVFFLGKSPLLPVQIIWNNLVTDTAVAVPLGLESKFGDELQQPPRHPKVGIIFPGLFLRVGFMAIMMGFGIFIIFNWAQGQFSLKEARTITFATMVIFEWFRAFNARSDEHTVFSLGIFRNRVLFISVFVAILLQIAVIYVPFLQTAFSTVPLGIDKWGIAVLAGGSLFAVDEIRKVFFPRLFSLGKWSPMLKEKSR
jgi:Ca2+-transporting ATPase